MTIQSTSELRAKRCQPCEGGVEPISAVEAAEQVTLLAGWSLADDGKKIRKDWTLKDFLAGIAFFNAIARVAEDDHHHPDLRLFGYRKVTVELTTHAIGGLSENDFILAAKIDQIPVESKQPAPKKGEGPIP